MLAKGVAGSVRALLGRSASHSSPEQSDRYQLSPRNATASDSL